MPAGRLRKETQLYVLELHPAQFSPVPTAILLYRLDIPNALLDKTMAELQGTEGASSSGAMLRKLSHNWIDVQCQENLQPQRVVGD